MASSSCVSCIKIHHVFPSFHGPDVRRGFLSHLRNHFESKGITTFDDEEMERGQTIGPELEKAIRESRVSIVLLSKNYASSGWCLDELVEIMKCRKESEQIVMTIFFDVDPTDVRKQKGDFGSTFMTTCKGRTEEKKQIWSKALTDVANIEGEHYLKWKSEAKMIEKIATDVWNKLNVTPSRDFDGMVGLEAHLRKVISLLCLESNAVKMIGIWGPAGIGKSTIARALFNRLSSDFGHSCIIGNLKGSYRSTIGIDKYDSKLDLQSQLLSKIFPHGDKRALHLGAIKEWLHDQRVLIVLDDVDDLGKLEVLAKETSWFGPGSRIIVTTEDKRILEAHEIQDIYHVDFPSDEEAVEIFSLSAFKETSVRDGFEELAKKLAGFCSNLPLGLAVVGKSLRGENKNEWERQLIKFETSLDRDIEDVLKVGYDKLSKKDQSLFLHIACVFFFQEDVDYLSTMLADNSVENGLKTLEEKSLVQKSFRKIVMHSLLQKLGRQLVVQQSDEPGKRQFLVDPKDIREVLEAETGTTSLIGIHFDMTNTADLHISGRAFEGMDNLQFLLIYTESEDFSPLHIQEELVYLPCLRLLFWQSYPGKRLPAKFQPKRLVELDMQFSNLEKLWDGIHPLPNLKKIDLTGSRRLKEIPNLSKATNLETLTLHECTSLVELPSSIRNLHKLERLEMAHCRKLRVIPTNINLASLEKVDMSFCSQLEIFPDISSNVKTLDVQDTKIKEIPNLSNAANLKTLSLTYCSSLVELPSSISNLHKLERLEMRNCRKLRAIPTNINLASLEEVNMDGCSQLGTFPDISSNIKTLSARDTKIKDIPASVVGRLSRCGELNIGSKSLKRLTHVPVSVTSLDLTNSGIKAIPDCIIGLPHLVHLIVENCKKLVSIPALPPSLASLNANNCVSLKTVHCSFHNPYFNTLTFYNCLKLDEETRRGILQQSVSGYLCLPAKEVPAEFTHKATGKSITIPLGPGGEGTFSAPSRFKACFLLSPVDFRFASISCHLYIKGVHTNTLYNSATLSDPPHLSEHLFIFREGDVASSEPTFEFSCSNHDDKIIECGVQILTEEAEGNSNRKVDYLDRDQLQLLQQLLKKRKLM